MRTLLNKPLHKAIFAIVIYSLVLILAAVNYGIMLVVIVLLIIIPNRVERILAIDKSLQPLQLKISRLINESQRNTTKPNYCYYLISQQAFNIIKPRVVSKPILHTYGQPVYTTIISDTDFEVISHMFKELSKDDQQHFWLEQIVPGQVDIKNFNLNAINIGNLFDEIENQLSITKFNNIAMVIFAICDKLKISPIQLFNQSK